MSEQLIPDPLDRYFWPSNNQEIIFSPWLWLAKGYQLTKDDEKSLRKNIERNPICKIVRADREIAGGCLVLFFWISIVIYLKSHLENESWNFQILSLMVVMLSISKLLDFYFLLYLYLLGRSYPKSDERMTFRHYILRRVLIANKNQYISRLLFWIMVSSLSSVLFIWFSDQGNYIGFIAIEILLFYFIGLDAYSLKVYCEASAPRPFDVQAESLISKSND